MKIIDVPQRSPEWFAARLGVPTSSRFKEIITTAGAPSKQKIKYLYQLAGEKVSGVSEETYQNAAMLRGIELEPEARNLYQMINTGVRVEEVGFCLAKGYGASPDGLVGTTGLLEIKCPSVATHIGYLQDNALPLTYYQQIQGQMLVTGRKWCDFMSYYSGIKPLFIRVPRDAVFLEALSMELKIFCGELKDLIKKIGG